MKLDHIGIAVANLEKAAALYADALGLEPAGPPVDDSIQQVRVQFWRRPGDSVSVELIQPLAATSPTARQADSGGGFAHLCYQVEDIDGEVQAAWQRGGIIVRNPVAASAFNNRRIAFVFFRDIGLVEFVEAERPRDGNAGS